MKKVFFALFVLFAFSMNAQEIKWLTFEEAVAAQKENPKKIIMDAYTSWCGWCKKMDKETFKNKDVVNYINEHFYAVKFDAEGNETINFKGREYTNPNYDPNVSRGRNSSHQLSQYFSIRSFPTIVYLDEEANLISPIPGYKTPQQLELFLKTFKTDVYKTLTDQESWETYNANFKYEFVN
ncbi:thioredoxin family protein [Lutibacter holmesii]|uniref:Thioredoxin family protein n=1 Tax=Lutibacter holmesii TaxID=1137985 RepID=A0ABW3WM86_9FLAO